MRNAFAEFCDALFNDELRRATLRVLKEAKLLQGPEPPESREARTALIKQLPHAALLELIYRYQFLGSDARAYDTVRSYIDNAPLRDQFIYEFLQNAQDAGATEVRFLFQDEAVLVVNDGRPFSPENLYAICSFRESDQEANLRKGRRIGKFGVGFKSLFRICDNPYVFTWDDDNWPEPLSFRFFVPGRADEKHHERLDGKTKFCFPPTVPRRDRDDFHRKTIGYLFPVPTPFPKGNKYRRFFDAQKRSFRTGTIFTLIFQKKIRPDDKEYLLSRVEPECFLFIQLRRLEVEDTRKGGTSSRVWEKHEEPLAGSEQIRVLTVSEAAPGQTEPVCSVKALRFGVTDLTVPVDRLKVEDAQVRSSLPCEAHVTLLVPLGGDGSIPEPTRDGGGPPGRVFNGLPVPGANSGLGFHIDAPFNLDVERMDVLEDEFNKWLIARVGDAAGELLRELLATPRFRDQAHRIVPADTGYGRPAGGRVTERLLRPIHDRLRAVAREAGVLPAVDGGPPLRPEEALALTEDGNAAPEVAAALQELFRGAPVSLFAAVNKNCKGPKVRLCVLKKDSHQAALVRAAGWAVEPFTPRWVETLLADPGRVGELARRDTRWHRHLLVYLTRGSPARNAGRLPSIAWVPTVCPRRPLAPPSALTLVPGAGLEDLQAVQGPPTARGRLFAHPDFTSAYLEVFTATKPGGVARERLGWLGLQERTWRQLAEEAVGGLPTPTPDPVGPPAPEAVLRLLAVAEGNEPFDGETAARLARRVHVPIIPVEPGHGRRAEGWRACDLWLCEDPGLAPPGQVRSHLPRPAPGTAASLETLWRRGSPFLPSPALVEFVLTRVAAPDKETVAWVLRVWKGWERAFRKEDPPAWEAAVRAVRRLRLPGRYAPGTQFHPLGEFSLRGFGERVRGSEKGLTELFGPREPNLGDYGAHFTPADYRSIQNACGAPEAYVPSADDVVLAATRLAACADGAAADRAADFTDFLGRVLGYPLDPGQRKEICLHLKTRSWLPLAGGGTARPGDVFLLPDRELAEFLEGTIPVPAVPSSKDRHRRLQEGLKALQEKGIDFAAPGGLNAGHRQRIAAALARAFGGASHERCRKLLAVAGKLVKDGWLKEDDLTPLRVVDLSAFHPGGRPSPDDLWVFCGNDTQARKLRQTFPRGVVPCAERVEPIRQGLHLITDGFVFPLAGGTGEDPATLLNSPAFARRYVLALGKVSGPLTKDERVHILRAYDTLCGNGGRWFDSPDEAVILTEAGTLAAAPVYAGSEPATRSLISSHAPGCCLAREVVDLPPEEREKALLGLGLEGEEY